MPPLERLKDAWRREKQKHGNKKNQRDRTTGGAVPYIQSIDEPRRPGYDQDRQRHRGDKASSLDDAPNDSPVGRGLPTSPHPNGLAFHSNGSEPNFHGPPRFEAYTGANRPDKPSHYGPGVDERLSSRQNTASMLHGNAFKDRKNDREFYRNTYLQPSSSSAYITQALAVQSNTLIAQYTKQVDEVRQQYQERINEEVQKRKEAERSVVSERGKRAEEVDQLNGEVRSLKSQLADVNDDRENFKAGLRDHANAWMANEKVKHSQKVRSLEAEIEELKDTHQAELTSLQSRLAELQIQHTQNLKNQEDHFRDQLSEAEQTKLKEIAQCLHKENQLREEMQALESSHEQAMASLKQKLTSQYAFQTKAIREDLEALNIALLNRDDDVYRGAIFSSSNLPDSPDGRLRDQYMEILQIVDKLSRVEWRETRKIWSDDELRQFAETDDQRLLRKALVHDMIWTILFRSIFCSPFRMFGDAGRKLEKEWNDHCGTDPKSNSKLYKWPAASIEAERWRYMTMKECRDALGKPQPSELDARRRVRDGFRKDVNSLVAAMNSAIAKVADVSSADYQAVQHLSTKASLLWFDCCMHRYRIVVRLLGVESPSLLETPSRAQERPLKITIFPEVGRYGNVKGTELQTYTVISGCAGEACAVQE